MISLVENAIKHDLFHVYTVDEHILMVIRNLRRFTEAQHAHEYPLCSRLIADFERKEVLYLAGLFHDIAKGRGGDHSVLGARDAQRFCAQHELSAEDAELIAWLVGEHLTMSQTAQKQDVTDPAVVGAFAARVRDERHLVALYLLTVADIRGTSPKVWNAWKGKLLEDLFHATRAALLTGTSERTLRDSIAERQREAQRLLRLYAVPDNAEQRLWRELDTLYLQRHTADEIAWHDRRNPRQGDDAGSAFAHADRPSVPVDDPREQQLPRAVADHQPVPACRASSAAPASAQPARSARARARTRRTTARRSGTTRMASW